MKYLNCILLWNYYRFLRYIKIRLKTGNLALSQSEF